MTRFDDAQYRALLDDPNELEVEYKSWLDLSSKEMRADLARHIAALANYGGGSIVFGITDAMQFAGPNPLPSPRCDRDLTASIVKRYLEPTFQCDVRDVVSSAGNSHPIVIVPPHGAIPICAKANGPTVNNRTVGIVQGVQRRAMRQHGRFTLVCGRLRVGKDFFHVAALVGAPVCSAFQRGSGHASDLIGERDGGADCRCTASRPSVGVADDEAGGD